MSFPGIIRRLFANNGAGPLLRGDILPLNYGTCSTAAGTAAKVVSIPGFALATGAEVTVRFTVTNTASSPTLNVNNTGAKPIQYRNAAIAAGYLAANRTYRFVYDGSSYELVGDVDTNTTYTAATAAPKAPASSAAVGTSAKYAREDHVHPLQTSVSGNSGTATKLATKRTISLTGDVTGSADFDGSANAAIPASIPALVPVGGIVAFSGTFSGRNPVDMKSKKAMTSWCLCDGTTTNGLAVPDLRGRMILGASSTYAAGSKGGSATHTHSISGTVGATTLTVEQLASHWHYTQGYYHVTGGGSNECLSRYRLSSDPVDSSTSILSSGNSQPHTHTLDGASEEESSLPPYYTLAYIMRCA